MERGDEAIERRFAAWDRQIARLQERCLAASGPEADGLRAVLADLAMVRERAWSRWEEARAGGMWVRADDVRRFGEAMREGAEAFRRAGGEGPEQGSLRAA